MTSLLNKFIAVGTLTECIVNIYPTHIRAKLALRVNDAVITTYYSINRKFHQEQYADFMNLISYLKTLDKCYVKVYNENYYEFPFGSDTRLFISGNISERKSRLFFNAENIKLATLEDDWLSIDMQGIWTELGFMNIVKDSPRVFNLQTTEPISNEIYHVVLQYNTGYTVDGDTIVPLEKCDELAIKAMKKCDKRLDEKDVENWKLEWSIIEDE